MNAPPFPANPSTGDKFMSWVWNGSRWVCTAGAGTSVVTQKFTASAPYTPSPGLVSATVECFGGGGGGGDANNVAADQLVAGGGGGSGGYSRITLAAALVLGGVNVTIGAGGAAQASGGTTSFGSMCVANGGGFAVGNNGDTVFGQAGSGAPPGVGDLAFPGSSGTQGATLTAPTGTQDIVGIAGVGGAMWGGNVQTQEAGIGGGVAGASAYPNTGAGGSGAVVNQRPTGLATVAGGNGGSGLCIVTEYCWADATDNGCGCAPTTGAARVAFPQGWQGGFDD
jgi:hypothetical protein